MRQNKFHWIISVLTAFLLTLCVLVPVVDVKSLYNRAFHRPTKLDVKFEINMSPTGLKTDMIFDQSGKKIHFESRLNEKGEIIFVPVE